VGLRGTRWLRFRLKLEEWKESFMLTFKPWAGKIGWALFIIQLVLALYAVAAYYPQGMKHYQAGYDWFYKYPVHAPPCWAVKKKAQRVVVTTEGVKPIINITSISCIFQGYPQEVPLRQFKIQK